MYRILIANGGSYYVQKKSDGLWQKRGGFFYTRRQARDFIDDLKRDNCCHVGNVVEYVR